jgi:RNA polymerase sigma factor (TIGR02999 family)
MADGGEVSRLLRAWADGNQDAQEQVVPLIYDVLRRLAAHHLAREQHAVTLQPTALVHEAYMRMVDRKVPDWNGRNHFFGIAAKLMRQILVEHARARRALKRGGGAVMVELEDSSPAAPRGRDVIALNDALDALEKIDSQKVAIMELRHFGGFTEEEIGRSLGISVATVRRHARMAEAWLRAELTAPGDK